MGPKEPEQMGLDSYPLTENEPQATAKVAAAFKTEFWEKAHAIKPTTASESFSVFGRRKVP
jgi:hippurate hydrolase